MNFINNQNIYSGISEKVDGPMKNSPENQLLFFKNKRINNKIIISAGLAHKNTIIVINDINQNKIIPDCDALITNQDKYLLTITVADCLPIYFYDKNKKVIALAHAGWRGVVSKIAEKVIDQFTNYYNSNLSDIEVFIGPHIKDCHFEVKNDVADQFEIYNSVIKKGKIYVNLAQAVRNQLVRLGIPNNNIEASQECTYCLANKYFSFRRDNPEKLEAMMAYIGLR